MSANYFRKKNFYKSIKNTKIKKPLILSSQEQKSSLTKYSEDFYQYAIIDPGPMSCGVRIERFYFTTKRKKLIWFSILCFGNETQIINTNMDESFNFIRPFLIECHHISIESQEMFSKVEYQFYSALIFYITTNICNQGFRPSLYAIDVKLKTTYIGGPTNSKANGGVSIKKWTKEKALELCIESNDAISYNILINSLSKAYEDLSDVKCYCEGWLNYVFETDEIVTHFDKNFLR